jgi:sarcosine oxidase, subunit alpha
MSQNDRRVAGHPILGPMPARIAVTISFNDESIAAYEGEPLAAALLAHGIRALRETGPDGPPRGLYCAIGHCFECQVVVDGRAGVRACLTPVRDGMRVESMPWTPDVRDAHRSAS